jgi:RNA polymerase sigma-70 factor (ECF subfamily)
MSAGEPIESPRAFLATITTRLAIDQLRSARVRREQYVGEWLPEPVITDDRADPARAAELADSLSLAFLALLERLSPEQRAALLLRDVFGYEYAEIAEIVGTTPVNARQLATRARRHVSEERPRFPRSPAAHRRLAERFFAAARDGDLAGLERMLAEDVVLHGDGGGQVPALAASVHGRAHVARTFRAWFIAGAKAGGSLRLAEVNGRPGAMLFDASGRLVGVQSLECTEGEVVAILSIVNPDKLRHLQR